MRGMVFGQDADKLIVAATPAEVRQYGVGQAVHVEPQEMTLQQAADVMYRHGFEFNRMEPWIPAQMGMVPAYDATLRTRCGCERKYAVERRVNTVQVPIYTVSIGSPLDDVVVGVRRFAYKGTQMDRSGNHRLLYVEE